MATVFTHALVAGVLAGAAPERLPRGRLAAAGALLAVLPDLDVVAFSLGLPYGHPLGHRGFSHSLSFAAAAGGLTAIVVLGARVRSRDGLLVAVLLALATASHGILDAFSDAGRGVGFFIPLSQTRYFFPWRPLATSPIGIEAFIQGRAFPILWNEMRWVLLPVLSLAALAALARGRRSG